MEGGLLAEVLAYKASRGLPEVVTRRCVRLYASPARLAASTPAGDSGAASHNNGHEKAWLLDRACRLEPEYADEIVRQRCLLRPAGTWALAAKYLGSGACSDVQLYCVSVVWPVSWLASKGYTSFTTGFEEAEQAAAWHAAVQRQLSELRVRAASPAPAPRTAWEAADSVSSGPVPRKTTDSKGLVAAALGWLSSKEDKQAAAAAGGGTFELAAACRTQGDAAAEQVKACDPSCCYGLMAHLAQRSASASSTSSGSSSAFYEQQQQQQLLLAAAAEQRWVPYRHTNGVAIYRHSTGGSGPSAVSYGGSGGAAAAAAQDASGSEYMASSIVRGAPEECLAVLMDLASNTTILGPASSITLLEGGAERQVLRISVEATGMARRLCAPRDVIVERLFKREECGVDVILFSSCELPPVSPAMRSAGGSTAAAAALAAAASGSSGSRLGDRGLLAAAAAAAAAIAGGAAASWGACISAAAAAALLLALLLVGLLAAAATVRGRQALAEHMGALLQAWHRPVRAFVQGGYTISPREDGTSPECLVTCILKVDLGGWLGGASWLQPLADALGWVDAYVERMLMAVILVKDEVEQRRFLVQPFSILNNTAAAPAAAGVMGAAGRSTCGSACELSEAGGLMGQQGQLLRRSRRAAEGSQSAAGGLLQQQGGGEAGGFAAAPLLPGQAGRLGGGGGSGKQRSQGRLGRMASRIYALRPRLLRGAERSAASAASAAAWSKGSAASGAAAAGAAGSLMPGDLSASFAAAADAAAGGAASGAVSSSDAGRGAADARDAAAADPRALLASVGLPPDTAVVDPHYYAGGPQGPAARDSTLHSRFWSELHTPGAPAPFKLRSSTYLSDKTKVDGGVPQFVLGSVDLLETPGPIQHISRFLPAVRGSQAAYSFVVNLIIPGTPVLSLVAVFINEHHPDVLEGPGSSAGNGAGSSSVQPNTSCGNGASSSSACGAAADAAWRHQQGAGHSSLGAAAGGSPGGASASHLSSGGSDAGIGGDGYVRPPDTSDWQPFDHALHRFLRGSAATRTRMFKLIPHIAEGSWVIKQSVGSVPVIVGTKLQTVYYECDRYIEASVDVTSSSAAAYITGMVRGATRSLVIDLGFVLEGQQPEELPEALLGAFRLHHLDCGSAQRLDTSRELPLAPRPLQHHQLLALQAARRAGVSGTADAAAARVVQQQHSAAAGEVPSADGRTAAAAAADGSGDGLRGSERGQQQQQQQQQQQELPRWSAAPHRSSLPAGAMDAGSRTMTAHARSRSAASVDELLGGGGGSAGAPCTAASLAAAAKQSAAGSPPHGGPAQQQQQQQQVAGQLNSQLSGAATPPLSVTDQMPPPQQQQQPVQPVQPPSIRTSLKAAATAAAAGTGSGPSSTGGAATPQRQLLSSLLSFATGGGSSSDRGAAARAAGAPDAAAAAAAPALGSMSPAQLASDTGGGCASGTATPTALRGGGTPRALALAAAAAAAGGGCSSAGGSGGSPLAAGSSSGPGPFQRSSCSVATPPPSSVALRSHHRSSSTSEACRTPVGSWTASPTSGSAGADWSSKLSAAAYISRAHAAALAASLQHRSSHHASLQQPGSPVRRGGAGGSSRDGSPLQQPGSSEPVSGSAGWLPKRVRSSSTSSGTAAVALDQLLLQQHGSVGGLSDGTCSWSAVGSGGGSLLAGVGSVGGGGGGAKISAAEQLRLTQSALRTSSGSAGLVAAAQTQTHHHHSHHHQHHHSGTSSASSRAAADAAAGGAAAAELPASPQQGQGQGHGKPRRPAMHRRFASVGAV